MVEIRIVAPLVGGEGTGGEAKGETFVFLMLLAWVCEVCDHSVNCTLSVCAFNVCVLH